MRLKRERIFRITLNGQKTWQEPAGNRTTLETQHQLATDNPGLSVRVQERYRGGARGTRLVGASEED